MSTTEYEDFPRCLARAPHGGRCWRHPEHAGSHLVVKPGTPPTASAIEKIVNMRPDEDADFLRMAVAYEPIGKLEAAYEWIRKGGAFSSVEDFSKFFMWNLKRPSGG